MTVNNEKDKYSNKIKVIYHDVTYNESLRNIPPAKIKNIKSIISFCLYPIMKLVNITIKMTSQKGIMTSKYFLFNHFDMLSLIGKIKYPEMKQNTEIPTKSSLLFSKL